MSETPGDAHDAGQDQTDGDGTASTAPSGPGEVRPDAARAGHVDPPTRTPVELFRNRLVRFEAGSKMAADAETPDRWMIPTWLMTEDGLQPPDETSQPGPLFSSDGEPSQKTEE